MSNGVAASAVDYTTNGSAFITSGTNVAGYWTFGTDGGQGPAYYTNVIFQGNSGWYIMGSVDSSNGLREYAGFPQCYFLQWFFSTAFGGTNYSNTPIGAVTHTSEPQIGGIENTQVYFGLWAAGKSFASCAWNSRRTPYFQAVGDPFVTR
jgi:hypothetical protein